MGGYKHGGRPERLLKSKDSVRDLLVSAEHDFGSIHGKLHIYFSTIFPTFDLAIAGRNLTVS